MIFFQQLQCSIRYEKCKNDAELINEWISLKFHNFQVFIVPVLMDLSGCTNCLFPMAQSRKKKQRQQTQTENFEFLLNLAHRKVMIYFCQKGKKKKKKWGVIDFVVLERICPEKCPKSEKSGFVS